MYPVISYDIKPKLDLYIYNHPEVDRIWYVQEYCSFSQDVVWKFYITFRMTLCIYIYVCAQKGTPWECGFSLHSATTDTAHVPWFFHCFATIDNFCLVFLQWLNETKIKTKTKKQETKKTKQTKWQDPTLCHYSPPWGVQSCFFLFLVFLVSCFLVRCWFF